MPEPTEALSHHDVVCGYGRVGQQVVTDLRRHERAVVVVERDEHLLPPSDHVMAVAGDATDDTVLTRAGIARAHGLIVATGSDATNLIVTLSARALNPRLTIVARANQPATEAKLLRAGATRVVAPDAIGARRMATQLMSPGMAAFLDVLAGTRPLDLWLEEITIASGSLLVGQTIGAAIPRRPGGINVIAVRRPPRSSHVIVDPPPDLMLSHGDVLIVVGSRASLQHLTARASQALPQTAISSKPSPSEVHP